MQTRDGQLLFSASGLVGLLNCEHLSALELLNLETPLTKVEADPPTQLVQEKGDEHEKACLARLKDAGLDVVEINAKGIEAQVAATREAMAMWRWVKQLKQERGCETPEAAALIPEQWRIQALESP